MASTSLASNSPIEIDFILMIGASMTPFAVIMLTLFSEIAGSYPMSLAVSHLALQP